MYLSGKGWLTGCGLHEYSLISVLFQQVISILLGLKIYKYSIFPLCSSVLFVCCCVCIGGDKEDYMRCELIGGGSPRHLTL